MFARSLAAPPTPWSQHLAEPRIDPSAFVHASAELIGDVRVGANVHIAPGVAIRADEGSPFHIGTSSNIQDGAVIHGLEQGRVDGDDGQRYSVWIGSNASITHLALIHGPAYVGDDAFIGFRSTVFNAKVGRGAIVMMHALIQDVEIPPGKYVPAGSIITTQQQADRLSDVRESDTHFSKHVCGINDALRAGYQCAMDDACITSLRGTAGSTPTANGNGGGSYGHGAVSSSLSLEAQQQVRQLLAQGFRIGTEHADVRRFKANAWTSCAPIEAEREPEVFSALEGCLAEHAGEYVRLLGIDAKNKRRVSELIIQRPGAAPVPTSGSRPNQAFQAVPAQSGHGEYSTPVSGLSDLQQQVRQLLAQGYHLGIEFADPRRFKANAWQNGPQFQGTGEREVFAALASVLTEHAGNYVRLLGIDGKNKRRAFEQIIQHPGKAMPLHPSVAPAASAYGQQSPVPSSYGSTSRLAPDLQQQVRQLLAQGYRIGTEFADPRRFKANAWQNGPQLAGSGEGEVFAALESVLGEYAGTYVRLVGTDPKAKRRVSEQIIQRP